MSTRKTKEKNVRKLMRTGREGKSLGMTIPKEIAETLNWREKQKVVVKKVCGGILIKDWKE